MNQHQIETGPSLISSSDDEFDDEFGDEDESPGPNSYNTWNEYWKTEHGQPWRIKPEITEERREFLAERRTVKPDPDNGIYPLRDEHGSIKIERADVEWLLATHESDGLRGPVNWDDERQRGRKGIDLRGAQLNGVNMTRLPMARIIAGSSVYDTEPNAGKEVTEAIMQKAAIHLVGVDLSGADLQGANLRGAEIRSAHLNSARMERAVLSSACLDYSDLDRADLSHSVLDSASFLQANLTHADLRNTIMWSADFRDASLDDAHLEAASARAVRFGGAALHRAIFSAETDLAFAVLADGEVDIVKLADVNWRDVNLSVVDWAKVKRLGDEVVARDNSPFKMLYIETGLSRIERKSKSQRLSEYERAVRANRQLATALRSQGLSEHADRFAYRAQVLQRQVLKRQGLRRWPAYIGSLFLAAVAGYGYRPFRSLLSYITVNVVFATAYFFVSAHFLASLGPHLSPLDAIIFSMTSFHGRGFSPGETNVGLSNPLTIIAAIEAFTGLLLEITFFATFTQRFFAR
jgi:uncharacterized protein YjbI with pentapeptide repeats